MQSICTGADGARVVPQASAPPDYAWARCGAAVSNVELDFPGQILASIAAAELVAVVGARAREAGRRPSPGAGPGRDCVSMAGGLTAARARRACTAWPTRRWGRARAGC